MLSLLLAILAPFATAAPGVVQTESEASKVELDLADLEARIDAVRETVLGSTVGLRFRGGHATGVLVSEAGHILTVAHAMSASGRHVTVVLSDGRELDGVSLGRNEHSDFGMVKIAEESEPWIWSEMAPDEEVQSRQACLATGFPGWISKSRGPVLRFGVVESWTDDWLKSSCTIMPGDSGGPIFDLEGRVLGISSWIERSLDSNYAVPVTHYRASWERLELGEVWDEDDDPDRNRENVPRGQEALQLGLRIDGGRRSSEVIEVLPDSPAERAGVLVGDQVRAIGPTQVTSRQGVEARLARDWNQPLIHMRLQRAGTELKLALERRPAAQFPQSGEHSLSRASEELAERVRQSVATIHSKFGRSQRKINAVIVDCRGYLLTKASELGEEPVTETFDKRRFATEVIAIDDSRDLALLKIECDEFAPVEWHTDHKFDRGQWLVSAVHSRPYSSSGVVSTLPSRVRGSRRAYLGIRMENAQGGGALIQTVEPGTAAQRAGLRNHDVIRSFNDTEIDTYFDLQSLLRRARPGQDVALRILRDEEQVELSATLGRRPPQTRRRSERHVADTVAKSLRRSDFPLAVRHDANVPPSECGSPLLDSRGRVIGINIARLDRTGTLALPASEVWKTLERLLPPLVVDTDSED